MSREIKFRAWDENMNQMLSWEELQDEWRSDGYFDSVFRYDHWIPMEYTGLKDKNGKEIYEGDLFYYHGVLRQVIYREDNASFMAIVLKGHKGSCNFYLKDIVDRYETRLRVPIIGNIYENSELLKLTI